MWLKRYIPAEDWCPQEGAAVIGAVCGIAVWQIPWTALFVPFLWLFFRKRKWIFTVFAVLAALSVWIQGGLDVDPAPKSGKWVRAVCKITDSGLCRLPEMPQNRMIKADLLDASGVDGKPLALSGRILLRVPEEFTDRLFAGDILKCEGVLSVPHGSFAGYAAARRIKWIFSADECKLAGADTGSLPRKIAELREPLLYRAVKHLKSEERRMMAATLFFGVRGGMNNQERKKLIHAGVIHLYSVSGLHVGIFAAVLMIFLRGLPGRWKYGVLIPLTLLYVLSTGANVPAVRAWIMIAVWAACRVFLYWVPVRRVLGYAAAGMLIWQPAWLFDMGFLYSFEITLILLLLGQNLQMIRKHMNDPAWMMPRTGRRDRLYRILRIRNTFWSAVLACVFAFLGGAANSLLFQGVFLPGSVIANLLLMPVIGLLFPVMALKIATGWGWVIWDKILAVIIDFAWDLMDGVIAVVQCMDATVTGSPSLWSALLFLAALIIMVWPVVPGKMRVASGVICAGLLIFWHCSMLFRPAEAVIVHGNYAEVPAVAVADTRAGIGIAVNIPDGASAVEIADFFLAHGISSVDRVLVSAPRSGNIRGMKTLMQRIQVRQFVLPEMDRYSGSFKKMLREQVGKMPELAVTDSSGNIRIFTEESMWRMEYCNPGTGVCWQVQFGPEPETVTVNGRKLPFHRSSETVKMVFGL